ncbi:MAG: hypothetical protein V7K64_02500 [Nostoc sp.]
MIHVLDTLSRTLDKHRASRHNVWLGDNKRPASNLAWQKTVFDWSFASVSPRRKAFVISLPHAFTLRGKHGANTRTIALVPRRGNTLKLSKTQD